MSAIRSHSDEIARIARLFRSEADATIVRLALGCVLAIVAGGMLSALSPLVMKSLVDALAAARLVDGALSAGSLYLALLLAGRLLADLRPWMTGTLNQRVHGRLTRRFFGHVLRLPLGYLHKRRSGELLHSLDLGTAGAQLVVTHLTGSVLPVAVELITMMVVLIRLEQPALVAVFAAAAVAYLAIFALCTRATTAAAHAVSASSLETYARLGDGLAHLETLRCFAAEAQAYSRLQESGTRLERRWQCLQRLNAASALWASIVFGTTMAASLAIAAHAVANGAMSIGGFVLVTVYTAQMVRPLESLGATSRDLSRSLGYLRPLLDLLAEPLPIDELDIANDTPNGRRHRPCAQAIRIENLHFGYEPQRPVLRGVNLDVRAGSTMAIVGRSGCGKSSLARLLLRLHAPQQGHILLDGRAIESIPAMELRGQLVGLVSQETALLHESIATNIALGTPSATSDDVRLAARAAGLGSLIDTLPCGLDTPVGERGVQLSGGERQRVGIARALLRRPGLYVLDEPTSMLDSRTEAEIQLALQTLAADATVIVIAHRLSTIVDADEIAVLDEGRIRERGNHRALLAMDGLYAQMWRQQVGSGS